MGDVFLDDMGYCWTLRFDLGFFGHEDLVGLVGF
jgi:hypothetical protein